MLKSKLLIILLVTLMMVSLVGAIQLSSSPTVGFSEKVITQVETDLFYPCYVEGKDTIVCEPINAEKMNEWALYIVANVPPGPQRGQAISALASSKTWKRKVSHKVHPITNESYVDDEMLGEVDLLTGFRWTIDLNEAKSTTFKTGFFTNTFEITDFYYGNCISNCSIDETVEISNTHISDTFDITDRLIAYFKYGSEDNSTTVVDSINSYDMASLSNVVHTHEHYDFDGYDSYIRTTGVDTPLNDEYDSITISMWIKLADDLSNSAELYKALVANRWTSGANRGVLMIVGATSNVGQVFLYPGNGTCSSSSSVDMQVDDWNTEEWHHVVMLWNSTQVRGYLDGEFKGDNDGDPSKCVGGNINSTRGYRFHIGSFGTTTSSEIGSWNGSIDEVAIWNKTLSDEEIEIIYREGLYKYKSETVARNITDSNLVSYYNFTTDAGDSVNGNDGTVSGATLTNGHYEFDTAGEYIEAPPAQNINFTRTNEFSVSAWFKSNQRDKAAVQTIASQYHWSDRIWYMNLWVAQPEFHVWHNNSIDNTTSSSATDYLTTANLNDWHHAVGVWNGTNTLLYINGILKDTDVATLGVTINDRTEELNIGNIGSHGNTWNGSLDEVALYNKSLTLDEIKVLYMRGKHYFKTGDYKAQFRGGVLDAGLEAYWGNIGGEYTSDSVNQNITFKVRRGDYAKPDITDSNLVAYWTLNSTSGYVDYFSLQNMTLYGGVTNVSGVFEGENGTEFDGIDGYAATHGVPGGTFQDITASSHSICFWIKLNDDPSATGFRRPVTTGTTVDSGGFDLDSNGDINFFVINSSGSTLSTDRTDLSDNLWHQICGTYNVTTVITYKDGDKVDDTSSASYATLRSTDKIRLTRSISHPTKYVNCRLAHVLVWNRTLTPDEILNWTAWSAEILFNEGYINTTDLEKYRFIQYEAYLRNNDTKSTPSLIEVSAEYSIGETTFKLHENTGAEVEDSESESIFTPEIWFTETTSTRKTMASNMSGDVDVEVTFEVDTCKLLDEVFETDKKYIKEITYTKHGSTQQLVSLEGITCSNDLFTETLNIAPALSSNTINIIYAISYSDGTPEGGGGAPTTDTNETDTNITEPPEPTNETLEATTLDVLGDSVDSLLKKIGVSEETRVKLSKWVMSFVTFITAFVRTNKEVSIILAVSFSYLVYLFRTEIRTSFGLKTITRKELKDDKRTHK